MTTTTAPSTVPTEWSRDLTSRAERYAAGKALHSKTPRSSHAQWAPDPERPDPISILEESNKTRLENLVPIRYGHMSLSPFAFLRGSAGVMANDLAKTPVSGIQAQLCGDAHLSNFGVYASPERRQVFDVNDFDETLAGPWEWDVKRLAASVVVAGRQNGYTAQESRQAVLRGTQSYREHMQQFALMNHLDVWYFHLDVEGILAMARGMASRKELQKRVERASERASKRTRIQTFPKLAEAVNGQYRIKDEPPLIYHYDPLDTGRDNLDTEAWRALVREYLSSLPEERRMVIFRYRSVDIAQKVVGVGSVGTRCAIVLALGGAEGDDPLFMQIKEAQASVLEPYVGASPYKNHGEGVVIGQRLMQVASDVLLGWFTFDGAEVQRARSQGDPARIPLQLAAKSQRRSEQRKEHRQMAANSTTEKTASTSAAKKLTTYDLVIGILALFSLIILVFITFVPLPSSTVDVLNSLENILCIVFLFDFFRSLFRAPKKWGYFLKGGGWLDLLGSLPFNKFAVFRVARLFRVVRLLRKLTGGELRRILTRRLAQSTLLFTLVIALLLIFTISWIVLEAEQGAPHANITTYPNAIWWAFVTITTVGYGDYYPVTTTGRTGAVILMFFGIGIIGVLLSYLSSTFISRQRRRRAALDEGNENDEEDDHDDSSSRDAELAAMREELAALRKLFEERYQTQ